MKSRRDLKSRREFLRPSPREEAGENLHLLRLGRPAMGSRFEAALRSDDRSFVREKALHKTGYRHILLNEKTRKVKFLRAGMEVNLGSTGKGYALDRAAAMMQNRGLEVKNCIMKQSL